jgi:hypothetical protein
VNDGPRILAIGNCGAGKSYLGERLERLLKIPWIQLDAIRLKCCRDLPDCPLPACAVERHKVAAWAIACQTMESDSWIVEGNSTWLAGTVAPRATHLIWLDLSWSDCCDGILRRGASPDNELAALWDFTCNYWERADADSFLEHEQLFREFAGDKIRIRDRAGMTAMTERF